MWKIFFFRGENIIRNKEIRVSPINIINFPGIFRVFRSYIDVCMYILNVIHGPDPVSGSRPWMPPENAPQWCRIDETCGKTGVVKNLCILWVGIYASQIRVPNWGSRYASRMSYLLRWLFEGHFGGPNTRPNLGVFLGVPNPRMAKWYCRSSTVLCHWFLYMFVSSWLIDMIDWLSEWIVCLYWREWLIDWVNELFVLYDVDEYICPMILSLVYI